MKSRALKLDQVRRAFQRSANQNSTDPLVKTLLPGLGSIKGLRLVEDVGNQAWGAYYPPVVGVRDTQRTASRSFAKKRSKLAALKSIVAWLWKEHESAGNDTLGQPDTAFVEQVFAELTVPEDDSTVPPSSICKNRQWFGATFLLITWIRIILYIFATVMNLQTCAMQWYICNP